MSYTLFILTIVSLVYLGVLVYSKNPKSLDNKNFLKLILVLTLWIIFNYFENINNFERYRIIFLKADFISGTAIAYYWYSFCYSFLEKNEIKKKYKFFIFLVSLILSILVITNNVIYNYDYKGKVIKFSLTTIFYLYSFFIIFLMSAGTYVLYLKSKIFKAQKKKQVSYVFFGFIISSFIALSVNLVFQNYLSVDIFRLGTFSALILVFFISYSITRFHLFDIKRIIQRGVVYVLSFSLVIIFYLLSVFIFGFLLGKNFELTPHFSSLITVILGIYGVPKLEKYFIKKTDKIFYKDSYELSEAMNCLSEVLNTNIKLSPLIESFAEKIKNILKIEKIFIVLLNDGIIFENKHIRKIKNNTNIKKINNLNIIKGSLLSKLEIEENINDLGKKESIKIKDVIEFANQYEINFFVKITTNNKTSGYILLGSKKSGEQFSREDKILLKTISLQAGVAVEKARLYEKVQDYSRNLEKKVLNRTKKIKGLQKNQKQMMLEIAHRLQTPLTVIKGDLGILKSSIKNNKNLDKFENSVNRLSKFIYDILKLARLENSTEDIVYKKVNLSQLVMDLVEYFEVVMSERKIKLKSDIEKDLYIMGDLDRLEELINNFVSNSVKYIGDKKNKYIKITLKKIGEKILLEIEDNGIGIDKKDQNKLFSQFYRSTNTNHNEIEGTGLGLVIAKKIADIHNGKIILQSVLGEGTKIKVVFGKNHSKK